MSHRGKKTKTKKTTIISLCWIDPHAHTHTIYPRKRAMNMYFPVKAISRVSAWWGICISHILEFLIMKWKIHSSMPNIIAIKMRDLSNCPKRAAIIEGREIVIIFLGLILWAHGIMYFMCVTFYTQCFYLEIAIVFFIFIQCLTSK